MTDTREANASPAGSHVDWRAPSRAPHPARDAALRSYDAVCRKAKDAWLDLFAEDGWVEDPVGPSMFDPDGAGHHGRAARSSFWDTTIANVERFVFEITDSFAAGQECLNVGTIHSQLNGYRIATEGVFAYRVDGAGKLVSLRAFWEWDRAMATATRL
ncbi:MAG: nuclear transport factor 2 family protein [Jatrophihabitans sp.]|nr:MAG: nuclear transport factor 2 family protein [Jatrophihabitans sp.]